MSCIHFKFKSSKEYDTLTFDGMHISLADLKKAILQNKKLTKTTSLDFDLQVVNGQTGEVYKEAEELIPKNTSVVVSRIPIVPTKKPREMPRREAPHTSHLSSTSAPADVPMTLERLKKTADLASAKAPEEDKVKAMFDQSVRDFDPSKYVKPKYPVGRPRPDYVCFNCNKPGHYIQNCTVRKEEGSHRAKRSTGIPTSFLTPVPDPNVPGAVLTPTGQYAVNTLDAAAYREGKKEKPPFVPDAADSRQSAKEAVRPELSCTICKDLISDAVIIPCCGNSFCDECIRNALLASDTHTCPKCGKQNQSPDQLIANKFLRDTIKDYLNDKSGYTKVKANDRTSSATPDVNSPSLNSPGPSNSPAPPQETNSVSIGQKFHDLPPELVGLPPQVIRARQAELLGKTTPPSSHTPEHPDVSSPRISSPSQPSDAPPGVEDYGAPQAIASTLPPRPLQSMPPSNLPPFQPSRPDFNSAPKHRERYHERDYQRPMGNNFPQPRNQMVAPLPLFGSMPPNLPMPPNMPPPGPRGLPDKVTTPLQLPAMNVPPPGFATGPRAGLPPPPGTLPPQPPGPRDRDMRFGPPKPSPLSRTEFYKMQDEFRNLRRNKSFDPLEGAMEEFIRGSGRRRPRSRSRSSSPRNTRSRSRTPPRRRSRSRSLSRGRKSRSRSRGRRSRSRSPARGLMRSRSRSPVKRPMHRSRSKSPLRRPRSRTRTPPPRSSRSPLPPRASPRKSTTRSPAPLRRSLSPLRRSPAPSKADYKSPRRSSPSRSPVRHSMIPGKGADLSLTPPPGTAPLPPRRRSQSPSKTPPQRSPSPFKIRSPLQTPKSPGRAGPRKRSPSPRHRGASPQQRRRSPYSGWPPSSSSYYPPGYDYDKYRYPYPAEGSRPDDYRYPTDPYHNAKLAEYFNYYREWYDRMRGLGIPPADMIHQFGQNARSRSPGHRERDRRSPVRSRKEHEAAWRDHSDREHRDRYDRRRDYSRDGRGHEREGREHERARYRERDEERRRPREEESRERASREKEVKKKKKKKDKKHKDETKAKKKARTTSEDGSSTLADSQSSPEKVESARKLRMPPSPEIDHSAEPIEDAKVVREEPAEVVEEKAAEKKRSNVERNRRSMEKNNSVEREAPAGIVKADKLNLEEEQQQRRSKERKTEMEVVNGEKPQREVNKETVEKKDTRDESKFVQSFKPAEVKSKPAEQPPLYKAEFSKLLAEKPKAQSPPQNPATHKQSASPTSSRRSLTDEDNKASKEPVVIAKKKAISPIRMTPEPSNRKEKKSKEKKEEKVTKPLKRSKAEVDTHEKQKAALPPLAASKWDKSSSEDEVEVPVVPKKRKLEVHKSTLPKSIIETAEHALANKPRKGAVVAPSVLPSPRSPLRSPPFAKPLIHKQASGGRKVFMERSPSPPPREKKTGRTVSNHGSFQVTVTASKDRRKSPQRSFDLREKLREPNDRRPSAHEPPKIFDRKISVMEEDIFVPDYDEDVEVTLGKTAAGKKRLSQDSSLDSDELAAASSDKKKHKKEKKKKVKKEKKEKKKKKDKKKKD